MWIFKVLFNNYRFIFSVAIKQLMLIVSLLCLSVNLLAQDSPEINVIDEINSLQLIADSIKFVNPELSISYYNQALQLAKDNDLKRDEAYITSKIGGVKYIQGEYDYSLEYYMISLHLSEDISDKKGIAVGYNNCAMIYTMQEKYSEAILYHQRSIDICQQIDDSLLIAKN